MKLILEFIVALILHPIAVILAWINIAGRADLSSAQKIIWALIILIWGIGPILYILLANGNLW
jgi:hypothetical protein